MKDKGWQHRETEFLQVDSMGFKIKASCFQMYINLPGLYFFLFFKKLPRIF